MHKPYRLRFRSSSSARITDSATISVPTSAHRAISEKPILGITTLLPVRVADARSGYAKIFVTVSQHRIQRLSVRDGYDLWSDTYDETPNPVVRMDARHTVNLLRPQAGEHILDAGCGTGRNFAPILRAGSRLTGVDFSHGMLQTAKHRYPGVPLALADLQQPLPFAAEVTNLTAPLCNGSFTRGTATLPRPPRLRQ